MFRRPMMRRGPGIVGTVARTAVIAGTATAVSKGVSGAMNSSADAKQQAAQGEAQQQADMNSMQQQMSAMQAQQAQMAMQQTAPPPVAAPPPAAPAAAAPAPAAAGTDLVSQLQQLAQLKTAGALTDAEFEAAKAKLLAA